MYRNDCKYCQLKIFTFYDVYKFSIKQSMHSVKFNKNKYITKIGNFKISQTP